MNTFKLEVKLLLRGDSIGELTQKLQDRVNISEQQIAFCNSNINFRPDLYYETFIKDVNYQLKTSSILQDHNPETACHIQVTSDWNLSPQGSRRFGLRRRAPTRILWRYFQVDDRLIATVNWAWNGYVDMSRRNPEYRALLCKVKSKVK
ncbi:hypothetical protein J6590_051607 [Homalodisca vitripennis]|nr:hypothetical protein J6590_051607 [Homalodisca vitripennis]